MRPWFMFVDDWSSDSPLQLGLDDIPFRQFAYDITSQYWMFGVCFAIRFRRGRVGIEVTNLQPVTSAETGEVSKEYVNVLGGDL